MTGEDAALYFNPPMFDQMDEDEDEEDDNEQEQEDVHDK